MYPKLLSVMLISFRKWDHLFQKNI